jgi:dihydroorotase
MMILKNARVVDPSQKLDLEQDVWIENGLIAGIDRPGSFDTSKFSAYATQDFKGKILVPGFIDVHVHLREPGFDYKETIESGTRAAVAGGFTSVACMANTSPVNDSAVVTRYILDRAKASNMARVFPMGAVTRGMKGEVLSDIGMMVEAGIRAISDDGLPVMNSQLMRKAMEYAQSFDIPVISHAEDLNLSNGGSMNEGAMSALLGVRGNPAASEEIMVAREIALARLTGARVHLAHLSTAQAVELVRRAKSDGLKVTAEVTPHHLLLSDSDLHTFCTHHKMAPPLRSDQDQAHLQKALNEGVIDIIASDHAPHGCVDKDTEFELAANGILGLQTTVPLMLMMVADGKLTLNRMIDALTVRPAQLLGQNKLGSIKVGSYADLTVIDMNEAWELMPQHLLSNSKNTPFIGRKFKGRVVSTWVNGVQKYSFLNGIIQR